MRQLWDWKRSVDVERLTPRGLEIYARICGWTLARAHARSGDRVAIAAYLGAGDAFDRAIAEFAEGYADQSERDHAALVAAIDVGPHRGRGGLAMKTWRVILILSAAQFILVLDTTVMNVSISNVVADLDTTVEKVQLAITAYMLVMASTMLLGGKLGDIWGRRRAFRIGLVVFAVGSGLTAIAPGVGLLLFGWSLVEGLGAAMMVPALIALIASNYEGQNRATAYGIIGAVAAAGAAAGPLIGGAVTTAWSWRVVFAGEVVIAAFVLLASSQIKDAAREKAGKLDWVGALLSIVGLVLIVAGVLQSSSWGWILPHNPPAIGGNEITPLGLSPVPFVILAGFGVLLAFARWSERRERRGERAAAADRPAADRAAARRLADDLRPAGDPDGDLLRGAALPPGGARQGRLRDRREAAAALDRDAGHGGAGAAALEPLLTAGDRPRRPARACWSPCSAWSARSTRRSTRRSSRPRSA